MEAVDRRPEQRFEVGIETRVGKRSGQGVEDVVDGAVDGFVFGQRPQVGLAGARLVAVELQLVENVRGGGCGVDGFGVVVVGRHGVLLLSD